MKKPAAKPDASYRRANRRAIALRVIYTTYYFFVCIYLGPRWFIFKPESAYMFKPYTKYILSAHIRRQYQKLYGLYLAELVTHDKDVPKEDVDELRQIAIDIGGYSKTLPSLKSLTVLLVTALSIIGTLFGIFDVKLPLSAVTSQGSFVAALALLFLSLTVVFAVTLCLFLAGFHLKRFLFRDNNSQDASFLSYVRMVRSSRANATLNSLYNSSVYKLEDEVFELLGGKERKPKEIPIDLILRIAFGSIVFANLVIPNLEPLEGMPSIITVIGQMIQVSVAIFVFGSWWIWLPMQDYKKRVAARLL